MFKKIIGTFLFLILLTTATVRGWRVALRSGPGKKYAKIDTLYQGYLVKILKTYRGWSKVTIIDPPDGGEGWVYRRLLRF